MWQEKRKKNKAQSKPAVRAPGLAKMAAVSLVKLIEGYRLTARSQGNSLKSIATVVDAVHYFVRYLASAGLPCDVTSFSLDNLRRYTIYLQTKPCYSCHRFTPQQDKVLSGHTVNCYLRGLQSFCSWLEREGFLAENPFHMFRVPPPPHKVKPTFSELQMKALLAAPDTSNAIGYRDYAIMLVLLDTGVRAGELCGIGCDGDIDLEGRQILVTGKGNRQRWVPIGTRVQKAIWKYRECYRPEPSSPRYGNLFLTDEGRPLTVDNLEAIIERVGKKAGVTGVPLSPHVFRHTMAVTFLRNSKEGGALFVLKKILGHSSLEVLKIYVEMAQTDVARVHLSASPVDNLDIPDITRTTRSNPSKPKGGAEWLKK